MGERSGMRRFWFGGRRLVVAAAAVVVLVAAGLGTEWATTGKWPLAGDRYCWGAWEENSGPPLLGDERVNEPGSKRTSEETAAPSAEHPYGTCTVRVETPSSEHDDLPDASGEDSAEPETESVEAVVVTYGPVPRDRADRLQWISEYLDGSVAPLPDGVPGLVSHDKGMVVLPRKCDVDGRPATVTINSGETTSIGNEQEAADLLLSVANSQMKLIGCAPGGPLRITSPMAEPGNAGFDSWDGMSPACGIPGLEFSVGRKTAYESETGAVTDDVQLCSVAKHDHEHPEAPEAPVFAGQFVVAAQPRMVALFQGLMGTRPPGDGWRGKGKLTDSRSIVEAGCGGDSKAVFFLQLFDDSLRQKAEAGPERMFARAVNSVAARIGCSDVAPKQ